MFKKKQKVDDFLTKNKVIIANKKKKWLHFRVEFYNLKSFLLRFAKNIGSPAANSFFPY